MTELHANWNYPTNIRLGSGRLKELAEACQQLGMNKPLLITDPGLAALPMVEDALAIYKEVIAIHPDHPIAAVKVQELG